MNKGADSRADRILGSGDIAISVSGMYIKVGSMCRVWQTLFGTFCITCWNGTKNTIFSNGGMLVMKCFHCVFVSPQINTDNMVISTKMVVSSTFTASKLPI